jgi:hypothetical protein
MRRRLLRVAPPAQDTDAQAPVASAPSAVAFSPEPAAASASHSVAPARNTEARTPMEQASSMAERMEVDAGPPVMSVHAAPPPLAEGMAAEAPTGSAMAMEATPLLSALSPAPSAPPELLAAVVSSLPDDTATSAASGTTSPVAPSALDVRFDYCENLLTETLEYASEEEGPDEEDVVF